MIRITNYFVPITNRSPLAGVAAERLHVSPSSVRAVRIVRRALDARRYHGSPLGFVYSLDVTLADADERAVIARATHGRRRDANVSLAPEAKPSVIDALTDLSSFVSRRPVVVGFGPAGMFCALMLAHARLAPLVLERGADVDTRTAAIERFWSTGVLDETTNVQFGEGGAGTFSDGKLTSRSSDPLQRDIIEKFISAGAPEEIRYLQKPHIGTDILRNVVKNIREEIKSLGGEIRFGSTVTDIRLNGAGIRSVIVNGAEEIAADDVFMGIGHSARDTYAMLYGQGLAMEPKAFAIGVRIEHPQAMIDSVQYGPDAHLVGDVLPVADYALTYQDRATGRGAYSFCMCPGGAVVAAASERERITTNGMSLYARDSGVANSALLVQIRPDDFGGDVLGGIAFQRKYEGLAFRVAGGDYSAPVESVGDFLAGKSGSRDFLVTPTYRPGVRPCDLRACLPDFVTRTLADALPAFGKKIKGFDGIDVPMTGVEMRSSSPCRIVRDRATMESLGCAGLYPMGEGAGYAGGIMSAAVDGMKAALAFFHKIH